jgi:flagellar biogenesis protein FliO
VLLVGGLGFAAWRVKRRRSIGAVRPRDPLQIQVLGSARVGPKAQATVIEVSGRVLMLGVTEQSVRRIAWLDKGVRSGQNEPFSLFDSEPPPARVPRLAEAARRTSPANENGSGRFREVLGALLGKSQPEPSAAEQIAEELTDSFESRGRAGTAEGGGRGTTERMPGVEGQAAGLAARFHKAGR